MNDYDRRVARGAAVLDHFVPDWEYRVNPGKVTSIAIMSQCVLCAVFGNYSDGTERLFGAHWAGRGEPDWQRYANVFPQIVDCGFAFKSDYASMEADNGLVQAWRKLIYQRRAAVVAVEQEAK